MDTTINIKQVAEQIASTLHEPAVHAWRLALLQNKVYTCEDAVTIPFFFLLAYLGYLAFKKYDPKLMGYADFPVWAVLAGVAWLLASIGIPLCVFGIVQRVVNPEWSAACDAINALKGN